MKLEISNEGHHNNQMMVLTSNCGCSFEVAIRDDGYNDDGTFTPCETHESALLETLKAIQAEGKSE